MLSHCANPQCSKPFLRLREGRLFLVETVAKVEEAAVYPSRYVRKPARRVERYWLCDLCAEAWTLMNDRNRGIVLAPRPKLREGASLAVQEYRGSV